VKRNSNSVGFSGSAAKGFSLLELMISMCMLVLILGAVFEQINSMQRKSSSEAMKVDLSQQAREFVDQTVRDLHMAGYPGKSMYSNPQDLTRVAAGLVRVSPTEVLLEGDVNNDGNVYSVNIYYVPTDPNDSNCPCIRRRAIVKRFPDPLQQPVNPYYTETGHVFPPGTGAGQSGEDLFAYYDQNGEPVDIGSGVDVNTISKIKTVKINLSLLTNLRDPATNGFVRTSLAATARLNQ